MFRRVARVVNGHAITVIVVAFVALGGACVYGLGVFKSLTNQGFYANDTPSAYVYNAMQSGFQRLNPSVLVLITAQNGQKVGDATFDANAQKVIDKAVATDGVQNVVSYYNTRNDAFVAKDNTKTYAAITFKSDIKNGGELAHNLRTSLTGSSGVDVKVSGNTLMVDDISEQVTSDLRMAETVSFIILAVLLVFVFRSLIAAAVPLLLGGFSILLSFLLLRVLSEFTVVSEYAINIIIALGLGLSIDYSLLIVSRFREELIRQKTTQKAITETIHTAGHTVFFSGLTVVIALLALALFPIDLLRSMGLGGACAVIAAMLSGLVVLPAILTLLGKRINSLSFGSFKRDARNGVMHDPAKLWYKLTHITMRRPVLFVGVALVLLVVSAWPLFGLNIGTVDENVLPSTSTSRQVFQSLKTDFPESGTTSMLVIYESNNLTASQSIAKLYDYTQALGKVSGVANVGGLTNLSGMPASTSSDTYQALIANPSTAPPALRTQIENLQQGNSTVITVERSSEMSIDEQHRLVERVRGVAVPTGASVQVGGPDALTYDQLQAIKERAPWAVAWIVLAIGLLMFIMLGSIVLPFQAMLMNMLSLSVAIGTVVWVFQDGHLAQWLGLNAEAAIDITTPMIILAIAFGLSMDYSVFLYGRIREEYMTHGNTRRAVVDGLAKTGGIITSAALLLFVVVGAFATSKVAIMQQIGFGLAVAVLVDAFIVRVIVVPSLMALMGKTNWYAPKSLTKLLGKVTR